jgi:hypothetical protein
MTTTTPEPPVTIDEDTKIFIAGVLGESSVRNSLEEMTAIAEVLIRQRKARDRSSWKDFVQNERNFAYAFSNATPRYALVINTKNEDIATKEPMATAYRAVIAAQGGSNLSKGAYFWDGLDFKIDAKGQDNKTHEKRLKGFKYGNAADNIFDVPEHKINLKKDKVSVVNGKQTKISVSADSVYESTVAYSGTYEKTTFKTVKDKNGKSHQIKVIKTIFTGTIFWKLNPDFVKYFHYGVEYK